MSQKADNQSVSEFQGDRILGDFLTEGEVMDLFGVSKAALYNLRAKRGLPYILISQRTKLYHEASLRTWLLTRERRSDVRQTATKSDETITNNED